MKVTIYFNASYPYGYASTNRVHQIAKGLAEKNVDLQVIITNATENHSETLNNKVKGNHEGVEYSYISSSTVRHKNIVIRKSIDFYCYLKLYFKIIFQNNDDFAILIGGAFFDFRLAIPILMKFKKTKIILEINEYPYINLNESILKKVKNFTFFKIMIQLFDGFIVISDSLSELLKQYKVEDSRIIKIPVLYRKQEHKQNENTNLNYPFIIHSGSIFTEEKDGILGCMKAFKLAKEVLRQDIKYIIVTNTINLIYMSDVLNYIRINNLGEDIVFLTNLTKKELVKYYDNASLAIINKENTNQNIYGFATKISEYVAYKIPLILTQVGEINNYFKDGFNALFVPCNNTEILSEKIVQIFNSKSKSEKLAENATKLSETVFNPNIQAGIILKFMQILKKE